MCVFLHVWGQYWEPSPYHRSHAPEMLSERLRVAIPTARIVTTDLTRYRGSQIKIRPCGGSWRFVLLERAAVAIQSTCYAPGKRGWNITRLRIQPAVKRHRLGSKRGRGTTLIWGRNQGLGQRQIFNGYLAESTLRFGRQSVWGRIENADRTNELLLGENPLPPDFKEHFAARVQAYSFGYDHEIGNTPHLSIALGGQLTFYGKPSFLDSIYGNCPLGGLVFLRLRPVSVQR